MKKEHAAETGSAATVSEGYVRKRRSSADSVEKTDEANTYDEQDPMEAAKATSPLSLISEISKMFINHVRHENANEISGSYRNLIFHLARKDGHTQLELAQLTHLKPPTVSISLAKLEEQGLIRREADPDDRRQTRVYLTEAGRELDKQGYVMFRKFESDAISCLDEDELAKLIELLTKVKNNIKNNQ